MVLELYRLSKPFWPDPKLMTVTQHSTLRNHTPHSGLPIQIHEAESGVLSVECSVTIISLGLKRKLTCSGRGWGWWWGWFWVGCPLVSGAACSALWRTVWPVCFAAVSRRSFYQRTCWQTQSQGLLLIQRNRIWWFDVLTLVFYRAHFKLKIFRAKYLATKKTKNVYKIWNNSIQWFMSRPKYGNWCKIYQKPFIKHVDK